MTFSRRTTAFPTRERLCELFRLEGGVLYWREHKNGRKPTLEAAYEDKGSRKVKVDGSPFREDDLIRIYLEKPNEQASAS